VQLRSQIDICHLILVVLRMKVVDQGHLLTSLYHRDFIIIADLLTLKTLGQAVVAIRMVLEEDRQITHISRKREMPDECLTTGTKLLTNLLLIAEFILIIIGVVE